MPAPAAHAAVADAAEGHVRRGKMDDRVVDAAAAKRAAAQHLPLLFPVGFQFDAIVDVVMDKSFWMMYTNTLFVTLYGTVYMMVITIFA